MLRRLIASSLIAVSCLSVFLPLAIAIQPDPVPACCRRSAHHHCTCCAHNQSGNRGPGFHDASRNCPCGSQITTRTVRGGLPLQVTFTRRSPAPEIAFAAASWLGPSRNRIHHSERGPPRLPRLHSLTCALMLLRQTNA